MEDLNVCKFCGSELVDGKCSCISSLKKMCLNCAFMGKDENGSFVCMNEENKENALEKIKSAVKTATDAYSLVKIEIAPVPLKKPTLKCGKWALSDKAKNELLNSFI